MSTGNAPRADTGYDDLVDHLVQHSALDPQSAIRVVREVLLYFDETPETFVKRRHAELKKQGLANPETFQQITDELRHRRFAAPAFTERQIRRIIYG